MALTRRRALIAKEEATEGVNASPSGVNDGIIVRDLEISVDSDDVEREIATPWLGANKVIYTKRQAVFNFDVEIAGSGTAGTPPAWGRLVKACGFSETIVNNTVVYSPVSSGFSSLTIAGNQDGIQYIGLGSRGSFEINFEQAEVGLFSFEFMGAYVTPADVVLPTPTYANQAEPLHFASGNTTNFLLDGYAFCLGGFSLDLGNEMTFRDLPNCAKRNVVTQRVVEGEIMVERPDTLAVKNLYPKIEAHTTVATSFSQGTTGGNIIDFSLPSIQLSFPENDDDDGILMQNYAFRGIPTGSGNNEIVITCR
jgi:hypothetical protein